MKDGEEKEVREIEKDIEKKLVEKVKRRGGIAPKWVSPGYSGVPDRLVFLPKGKFGLIETKAPGEIPRPLQKSRHRFFRKLGFRVYVVDGVEMIDRVLDEIEGVKRMGEKEKGENQREI